MTALALVLEVAFLGLALGWRPWLQHRRTGDWGIRRPTTPAARTASMLMVVGLAVTGIAPAVELAGAELPLLADAVALHVAGLAVVATAIAGTIHAQLVLGASWRIGVDPEETVSLVTTGPFGTVRNPIFSWMIVSAVGVTMVVSTPVAFVGTLVALAGVQLQVRLVEEPYLGRLHRAEFERYAARTGRFVPRLGRLDPPS